MSLFFQITYLHAKSTLVTTLKREDKSSIQIHDAPVEGHPGISNTWSLVKRRYTGSRLHQFVKNYVKGCAKCQESKVITHMKCTPLYHFDTHVEQGPFQCVSMNLIIDQFAKFDNGGLKLLVWRLWSFLPVACGHNGRSRLGDVCAFRSS